MVSFFDGTERKAYLEQLVAGKLPKEPVGRRLLSRLMNPAVRGPFLEALLRQSLETVEEFVADLTATGDERAVAALMPLLHSIEEPVVLATIDALRKLGSPAARPALTERADFDRRVAVRRAAAEALEQLPDEAAPSIEEVQLVLHSAYLTVVDGAGAQMALVARRWNEAVHRASRDDSRDAEDLASFHVIFDDTEGIQEAFGFPSQPSTELVDTLDDLEDDGLTPVPVPLPEIRAVVDLAYRHALERRGRVSVSFAAWESILAGDDPRRIPPVHLPDVNISVNSMHRLKQDFDVFAGCHRLLDLDEFGTWYFEADEISSAVEKLQRLQRQRGEPDYERRLVGLIRQTLASHVTPERRQRFRRRLERQAPLLMRLYDDPIHARRALAAAAGLAEEAGVPVSEHPLLQEMLVRSLEDILGRPLIDEQEGTE